MGAGHQALRVIGRCWKRHFEESEKWMLVLSVYLNLVKHVSLELEAIAWSHMFQQVGYLLTTTVLLVAKLVGGEGEDSKVARELLAQFIHLREVPDSCASQGGRVLHQHHLPLVLVHADHLPVQGLGPDVMEGHAVAVDVRSARTGCRPLTVHSVGSC